MFSLATNKARIGALINVNGNIATAAKYTYSAAV